MAKVWRSELGGAVQWEDDDTPEDVRSFNVFGKSVHSWTWQSRGLHNAAVALVNDYAKEYPDTKDPYRETIALMLGGYAIETLLKMVVIAAHCEQHGLKWNSKSAKDFVPTTHDLKRLASMAKLRINKGDRELLHTLSQYATWGGRYPIPLLAAGYGVPLIFERPRNQRPPPGQSKMWKGYTALYAKLRKLAHTKVFGRPVSSNERGKRR